MDLRHRPFVEGRRGSLVSPFHVFNAATCLRLAVHLGVGGAFLHLFAAQPRDPAALLCLGFAAFFLGMLALELGSLLNVHERLRQLAHVGQAVPGRIVAARQSAHNVTVALTYQFTPPGCSTFESDYAIPNTHFSGAGKPPPAHGTPVAVWYDGGSAVLL
jgi:hypothetical protein